MKAIGCLFLAAGVLIALSSCYWTPDSSAGRITIQVQPRNLQSGYEGYSIRVELYHPSDISNVCVDGDPDPDDDIPYEYYFPTSGAPIPIDGQPHFEVALDGGPLETQEGEFVVPAIPVGTYRIKMSIWDHLENPPVPSYDSYIFEDVSDSFEITRGENTSVDIQFEIVGYYYPEY